MDKAHAFVLSGSCSPDGQQTPFLPFIEVVRISFRLIAGETEAAVSRKLENGLRVLGLASDQSLGLLLNLLGFKQRDGAVRGLDGTLIGLRTRDLLQELLKARCRLSPVLMIFEDLHWMDSASETLLGKIVENDSHLPLLVLHTRRREFRPPWLGRSMVSHLPLEPLSSGETARIVQAKLGADTLPEMLARLVAEKAEGNALFAEEVASFLLERGMVYRTAGGIEFDAAAVTNALPESMQSLLTSRVDRLLPSDRALLQAAAVIGRRFNPGMLAAVSEASSDVETCLANMERFDLVYPDSKSSDYFFKHALVRDALYNSLLSAPRAALHLKVAQEIERRSGNRAVEVAEALAHHYASTPQNDKAFLYLSIAGEKSLDIFSFDEAEQYFRKALDLQESEPSCADARATVRTAVQLMRVLFLKADFAETKRIASRYMAPLEALGDTAELAFALYFQAVTLFNHECEFRACEAQSRRALHVAEQTGDLKAKAYALVGLRSSEIMFGTVLVDDAARMGAELIAHCECAGDSYILNWAYFCIAWDYMWRGLMNDARDWAWRLIESGRERDDRRAVGMAHWIFAYIELLGARYDEALASADECVQRAVTPFDRTAGAALKASAAALNGRIEGGLAQILELRRYALANGWLYAYRGMSGAAAVGLVLAGRIGEGIRLLQTSIAEHDKDSDRPNGAWNRIILAEIYLEIIALHQMPPVHVILKNFEMIVGAKLFGARRARILLEQAARNEHLHENGTFRARINMDLGMLHKHKKRPNLARQFLERARVPAELQGEALMTKKIDAALAELQ